MELKIDNNYGSIVQIDNHDGGVVNIGPDGVVTGKKLASGVLPAELKTDEAERLWKKLEACGWVDADRQPKVSRTKAAMIAFEMSGFLGFEKPKWALYEAFWQRKNMRMDYQNGIVCQDSGDFLKQIQILFTSID